mmetsp:Transcript_68440/g.120898  ORF Transcript_68440/g.120898 Transcript_68440/m.120898 type:complete len:220 (+) Transcript_68440:51-710(+)
MAVSELRSFCAIKPRQVPEIFSSRSLFSGGAPGASSSEAFLEFLELSEASPRSKRLSAAASTFRAESAKACSASAWLQPVSSCSMVTFPANEETEGGGAEDEEELDPPAASSALIFSTAASMASSSSDSAREAPLSCWLRCNAVCTSSLSASLLLLSSSPALTPLMRLKLSRGQLSGGLHGGAEPVQMCTALRDASGTAVKTESSSVPAAIHKVFRWLL